MKKVIIKIKDSIKPDNLNRVSDYIREQLETDGFIVLDNRYDVVVFDDGKEEKDTNHVENLD